MLASKSTCSKKRLEITMRDVSDGLEDAASYMNYRSTPNVVEILSIESPQKQNNSQHEVISPYWAELTIKGINADDRCLQKSSSLFQMIESSFDDSEPMDEVKKFQ